MLSDACINMPVTYTELKQSDRISDILYFLEDYKVQGRADLKDRSYIEIWQFMKTLCPVGAYFGADEFGVIGYWELDTSDYTDELEEFYERF